MKKVPVIIGIAALAVSAIVFFSFTGGGGNTPSGPVDDGDPKYKNQLIDTPTSGTPNDFDAKTNLYMANFYNKNNAKYYRTEQSGEVTAKVVGVNYVQTVSNRRIINDDEAFTEAISVSSMKQVGVQRYVTPTSYLVRKGSNVKIDGTNWSNDVSSLTKENYLSRYGGLPFGYTSYILNDYTVLSSEIVEQASDTTTFKYVLDTEISPLRYSYEVMTMGGASELPTFENVTLTVTMDNMWRVSNVKQEEKYRMPLFGGITCTAVIEENFFYEDESIVVPEREVFEKYFNAIPGGDIEEEKTAIDYLGEAFLPLMSSAEPLKIKGNIQLNKTINYDLQAKLGLKDGTIQVNIGDKALIYLIGDDAIVKLNHLSLKMSKSELMDVISGYLPEDFDLENFDISSLLTSPLLQEMLANVEMIKSDQQVDLIFKIQDSLEVKISLALNNDAASLKAISGHSLKNDGFAFSINFTNENIQFPSLPDDIALITNLQDVQAIVKDILDSKVMQLNGAFTLPIKDKVITFMGDVDIDFNDLNNVKLLANITVILDTLSYDISLAYQDSIWYLQCEDNLNAKVSTSDIKEIFAYVNEKFALEINLEDINKDGLLDKIKQIDFNSLLNSIHGDETGFGLIMDLSQFGIDTQIDIGFEKDIGFILKSEYGDVTFTSGESFAVIEDTSRYYLQKEEIIQYIDSIYSIIHANKFAMDIKVSLDVNDKNLDISGYALIDITNGLNFSFNTYISYGDVVSDLEVTFKKINDYYYLHFGSTNLKLSKEELKEFILDIDQDYQLGLSEIFKKFSESTLDNVSFDTLLQSFKVQDVATIDIDLNNYEIAKVISITYDPVNNRVVVVSDDGAIEASLEPTSTMEEIVEENETYASIKALEQMKLTIEEILKQRQYSIAINSDYFNGEIYLSLESKEKITFKIDGVIVYNGEEIQAQLYYENKTFYLVVEHLGIKLSNDEFLPLIEAIDAKFETDILGKIESYKEQISTSLDKNKVSAILSDVIENLSLTDTNLKTSVQIDEFKFDLDLKTGSDYEISLDSDVVELQILKAQKQEIVVPDVFYVTKDELFLALDKASNIKDSRLFSLSINISTTINKAKLDATGYITIDLTNGIDIQGQLDVVYDIFKAEVEIAKIGDELYLHSNSFNINLSYEELKDLLQNLNVRYNLGLDLSILPDTLTIPSDVSEISFENIKIKDIINMISLTEQGIDISLDPSIFGVEIGVQNINISWDDSSIAHINEGGEYEILVDYGTPLTFEAKPSEEYLKANDAIAMCDLVDAIMNEFKLEETIDENGDLIKLDKKIYFSFNTDIFNSVINPSGPRFNAKADVYLNILASGDINIDLDLTITGESNHEINLTYINKRIYCTYNGVNMAIDWQTLMQTVRYLNDTFKLVKSEFITELINKLSNGDGLDSSIFDDIIGGKEEGRVIVITDLFKSIKVDDNKLEIMINNDKVYGFETNYNTTLLLQLNNKKLSSVNVSYIYTNQNEYFSPDIRFGDVTKDITVPTGTYNLFANVDELVKEFVKTAELRNYELNGTVNVDMINIVKLTIDKLSIKLKIDEQNKIYGHIYIEIPRNFGTFTIVPGSMLNIYIQDNMIYIDDEYYTSGWFWSNDTSHNFYKYEMSKFFDENSVVRIIKLFHFTSMYEKIIMDAILNTDRSKPTFEKTFKEFRSDAIGNYYLRVDGGDLAGDPNIGEIYLTLKSNEDGYLKQIENLTAKMLKNTATITANVNLVNIGNTVDVPIPDDSLFSFGE